MSHAVDDLYVLIIAGGRGTRFWPRSRSDRPKQCLSVGGEHSLLELTIARVSALVDKNRILVITASDMVDSVRENVLDLPPENVLVEPEGRNTAPCVGWGAMEIGRRSEGSDAIMAVLPADHLIQNESAFQAQLSACAEAARASNALVTIGVPPTRPETGFGYLQIGESLGDWGEQAFHRVERFVEKPNQQLAQQYVDGGNHLWNAGMFVFTVEAICDAFRTHLPQTWASLETLQDGSTTVEQVYPELERISLDYGIMEKSTHVLTVKAGFDWSDVGSWTALGEHLPTTEIGQALVQGGIALNSQGNTVYAPEKFVALVGVSDLVVVDTEDALLICRKSEAQAVKDVVTELEKRGRESLL